MSARVKLEGVKELDEALKQLKESVSRRVKLEALEAGGYLIQRTAAALAPRSNKDEEHLADNIETARASRFEVTRRGGDDEAVLWIGPAFRPHNVFWGYFQEYGTARHAAHPFMRPAFDQEHSAAFDVIKTYLWHGIRKRLPQYRVKN